MVRNLSLVVCAILLTTLIAPKLEAATRKEKRQAKTYFDKGTRKYKIGAFEEALDAYSKAYELVPFPAFLFNIGQCHRQLGNWERAMFFYEGYLRETPDAPNREMVEGFLAQSKENLEREERERLAAIEAEELARREEALRLEREQAALEDERRAREAELAKEREAETVVALPAAAVTPGPETSVEESAPVYEEWWFWTAVAGGVVIVGGAIAIGVAASSGPGDPYNGKVLDFTPGQQGLEVMGW